MLDDGRRAVLKSPLFERLTTAYDGVVDFGETLAKERGALVALSGRLPVPAVLGYHRRSDDVDRSWLLLEYLDHDDEPRWTGSAECEVGRLVRALHETPNEALRDVPGFATPVDVAGRIASRLLAADRYCRFPRIDLGVERVRSQVGARADGRVGPLHLDIRWPNIAIRNGTVVGLLDFGNAALADPLLELGRVWVNGLLTEDFLRGYGVRPDDRRDVVRAASVHALDTLAMLVVTAKEELRDLALHVEMVRRTREAYDELVGRC